MIKSVVRTHHWSPGEIGKMFLDEIDYNGIEYWYNDIDLQIKKIETPPKK
jgi:hypothetical protein